MATAGRTIVDQSRAQKEQNSSKTREVENQAQVRPNTKGNNVEDSGRKSIPCKFSQNENANARPNQMQQKSS